jgi:hypothetical protein
MKIKYSIVSLALISLFAVSCGKKDTAEATTEKPKTEQAEEVLTKKDRKLLLNLQKNK